MRAEENLSKFFSIANTHFVQFFRTFTWKKFCLCLYFLEKEIQNDFLTGYSTILMKFFFVKTTSKIVNQNKESQGKMRV